MAVRRSLKPEPRWEPRHSGRRGRGIPAGGPQLIGGFPGWPGAAPSAGSRQRPRGVFQTAEMALALPLSKGQDGQRVGQEEGWQGVWYRPPRDPSSWGEAGPALWTGVVREHPWPARKFQQSNNEPAGKDATPAYSFPASVVQLGPGSEPFRTTPLPPRLPGSPAEEWQAWPQRRGLVEISTSFHPQPDQRISVKKACRQSPGLRSFGASLPWVLENYQYIIGHGWSRTSQPRAVIFSRPVHSWDYRRHPAQPTCGLFNPNQQRRLSWSVSTRLGEPRAVLNRPKP